MTVLRAFLHNSRAAAAAEMALILPGIAFVLLNVVDLSTYIYAKMQVDIAAHEAVGAARVLCDTAAELPATVNCGGTLSSTMTSAAQTTTLGTNVTLSSTGEGYYCATAAGELTLRAAANAVPPADCSLTVTGSTSAPGIYLRTTASYPYSPVFPGASVASLLTTPITRVAWIRLK